MRLKNNTSIIVVDGVPLSIRNEMKVNPPQLKAFWKAFQNGESKMERDHVIKLPKGTYFLANASFGSSLYIRRCFPLLLEICWKNIHETKTLSQTIMGTPGIGKTFFGLFLLYYLAHKDATVVYQPQACKNRYLFTPNLVIFGSSEHFDEILNLPTTYYIVDENQPAFMQAKTIYLTTPKGSYENDFFHWVSGTCYLPVWSKEEILTCKELLYPMIHPSLVLDPYERWGGIPRYFLSFMNTKEQDILFRCVLRRVNFDWFENVYGKLRKSEEQNMSALLVHFRVDKNTFKPDGVMFASDFILKKVYEHLYSHNEKKLRKYLTNTNNVVGPFGELCRQFQKITKVSC
jgi:hypothetical protein